MTDFVAVGGNALIATSPNGLAWTKRVSPITTMPTLPTSTHDPYMVNWRAVVHAPKHGRYIACGSGLDETYSPNQSPYGRSLAKIITSPDGVTWTDRSPPPWHEPTNSMNGWGSYYFRDNAWGALAVMPSGRVVVAGEDALSGYSDDGGLTWTEGGRVFDVSNGMNPWNRFPVACMHYSKQMNKIIAAPHERGQGDIAPLAWSSDGINWTDAESIDQTGAEAGTQGGWGYFSAISSSPDITVVTAGHQGGILTSTDGITWTSQSSPIVRYAPDYEAIRVLAWSPPLGLFVGIGSESIYTSPDGINWTEREPSLQANILDPGRLVWSDDFEKFFAAGWQTNPDWNNQPFIATSTTGFSFTKVNTNAALPPSPEYPAYEPEKDTGFNDLAPDAVRGVVVLVADFEYAMDVSGWVASFDASVSTVENSTIVSYQWDFADPLVSPRPQPTTGVTVQHAYRVDQIYQVKLTVTTESGETATVTKNVVVLGGEILGDYLGTVRSFS